jgi:arsenate reductase
MAAVGRLKPMIRVLFLCTHNSARSQMAEGMLRGWGGDRYEVASAGTEASFVRPLAIQAMAELGIDISGHSSKTAAAFADEWFDYAITVCADGAACPYFPTARHQLHWSFDDPSAATGTAAEQLAAFRRVRDQIAARIRTELLSA